jgi:hypothetical protein
MKFNFKFNFSFSFNFKVLSDTNFTTQCRQTVLNLQMMKTTKPKTTIEELQAIARVSALALHQKRQQRNLGQMPQRNVLSELKPSPSYYNQQLQQSNRGQQDYLLKQHLDRPIDIRANYSKKRPIYCSEQTLPIENNFKKTRTCLHEQREREDSNFNNYEQDPLQALYLFWESSALDRYQQDIHSEGLKQDIRATVVTDQVKEACLNEFKAQMDPRNIKTYTCAVCNTSSFDQMNNVPISQISSLLLLSQELYTRISTSQYKAAYTIFWCTNEPKAYYINPSAIHKDLGVSICIDCSTTLKKNKLPKYALCNGYDFGQWSRINLPPLSEAEKLAISFYQPFGKVIKLVAPPGLGLDAQQTGLRGHVIYFPIDGPQVLSTELPRRNVYADVQVVFIGSKDQFHQLRHDKGFAHIHDKIFSLRTDVIMQWLRVLREVNFNINCFIQD